jgi:hypothetical protein
LEKDMPMNSALLNLDRRGNVRLVPVDPQVKSAKTIQKSNSGVSEIARSAKSADPTCYNASRSMKTGLFEKRGRQMPKLPNELCADQARAQAEAGNYVNAMRWYNTAAARSVGHKRREAYEDCARRYAKMAGVAYDRCYFAEDYEAIAA